jgi:hypothetical protein
MLARATTRTPLVPESCYELNPLLWQLEKLGPSTTTRDPYARVQL